MLRPPARKGEQQGPGGSLFKPLRQVIRSVNETFKGQLDLEQHRGRRPRGATHLRRGPTGGRPAGFATEEVLRKYKERNTVERCIARLKQWRGLAIRTDKLALAYQAALHLAATLILTRR